MRQKYTKTANSVFFMIIKSIRKIEENLRGKPHQWQACPTWGERDPRTKFAIRCAKAQLQGSDLSSVLPLLVVDKPLTRRFSCWGVGGDGDASAAAAGVGRGGHIGVGRCMVNSDGRVHREDREVRPTNTSAFCRLRIKRDYGFWSQLQVFRV
jgi:hypothetical protein